MSKKLIPLLILLCSFLSCKNSEKDTENTSSILELANKYYKALDNSDSSIMPTLLGDSIIIREETDDYEEQFSKEGYITWLKWESVFEPNYTILDIQEVNGTVTAKLSKIDKRISFLHEEPMIWSETIRFHNDKIVNVTRTEYEVFNLPLFLKNRENLVQWIDENHPDLSGFLYPQNETKARVYLKAIELYWKEN